MAIMVGLMSVGLLVGCGGVDPEAQAPDETAAAEPVQAMRPPPCEYACDLALNACRRNAPTPEAAEACQADYFDCLSQCPVLPVAH
ncbi:hypothetical protein D7V97_20450 [Corallococcus sp. CA053C]|nr:hypothetical protein D7V97_20450 [Corallococcus sp. CA053C]